MAEVTIPIVNREHVLMVSPTVSSSAFLEKDDWFVMLHPSTTESGKVLADHVSSHHLARKITVVYDLSNRTYTQAWYDAFKAGLDGLGRTVRPLPFTAGQVSSWGAMAEQALAGGADGVAIVANALDTAAFCQQVRLRSAVPIFGAEWGFTHDALVSGGRAVEGAIFVMKVDLADDSPRFVGFKQAYLERFGRPVDFASVMAYEALQVLAEALRRDPTREGVRREVLSLGSFEGLQGPVRIDAFGDGKRRHYVVTVRDGRVVPAE
jgi:branched-chain amino acid transport system substrate-binding protein